MVLTRGDDYPLHQTPEPVAYSGTDRNFYDRYFFNGYAPDGSGFFAASGKKGEGKDEGEFLHVSFPVDNWHSALHHNALTILETRSLSAGFDQTFRPGIVPQET